jgi:hypothetical protein
MYNDWYMSHNVWNVSTWYKYVHDKKNAYDIITFQLNVPHAPSTQTDNITYITHLYIEHEEYTSTSLSKITYKRHINIVLCTMIQWCPSRCRKFLLGKNISMTNKMLMLQLSFTWTLPMPQLHKQIVSHTLHIYRLNMKNVNTSLTTTTYKTH